MFWAESHYYKSRESGVIKKFRNFFKMALSLIKCDIVLKLYIMLSIVIDCQSVNAFFSDDVRLVGTQNIPPYLQNGLKIQKM